MLFELEVSPAGLIYCSLVIACILSHILYGKPVKIILIGDKYADSAFMLFAILTIIILIRDVGFGGFLSGKYGPIPGGNIYLYYLWNSSLYIALCVHLFAHSFRRTRFLILVMSLLLLLISGDRTILGFVVILIAYRYSNGLVPLRFIAENKIRFLYFSLLAFLLFLGKDIYAGYASGLSIHQIYSSFNLKEILMRLEFWHIYGMINNIVENPPAGYEMKDMLASTFAFIPGSSILGIDPHEFSELIKYKFYNTWSDASGVGASLIGEAFVAGGYLGLFLVGSIYLLSIFLLAKGISSRRQLISSISLILLPLIVFYAHRNSLGQILSFTGRYVSLVLLIWLVAPLFRARFSLSRLSCVRNIRCEELV